MRRHCYPHATTRLGTKGDHAPSDPGVKGKMMKLRVMTTLLGAAVIATAPAASAAAPHKNAAKGAHKAAVKGAAKAHRPSSAAPLPQPHFGMLPAAIRTGAGVTAPTRTMTIGIGRSQLVTVPGAIADVFVASESVADVHMKSRSQLYVFGKLSGETTIYASNAQGEVIWSAIVRVGSGYDSIDQLLHLAMPDAHISTTIMNGAVLLTGTVGAPEDAAEAERLIKAYSGEKTTIITRLKLNTPLQVNLSVKIAEVSRSLTRTISSNFASASSSNGFRYGIGQGNGFYSGGSSAVPLGVGTVPTGLVADPTARTVLNPEGLVKTAGVGITVPLVGTALGWSSKVFGLSMLGALDLGEQIGLVTTLAEPNLTALSGETADFLAGGEYPIPVNTGLGSTTVEFKKYGVSLSYTPTVLTNGRISLRVKPEVSELTTEGSVTINGLTIPGLTVRRAETTVELGSGQSFMIAGLLKNNSSNSIAKMPGAGDVPVLGSLFRSTAFKKGESELVIVVTPYLVSPIDASQVHLPTDGFKNADALHQLLGNVEREDMKDPDRPKPIDKPIPQPAPTVNPLRNGKQKPAADTQPGFSIQ